MCVRVYVFTCVCAHARICAQRCWHTYAVNSIYAKQSRVHTRVPACSRDGDTDARSRAQRALRCLSLVFLFHSTVKHLVCFIQPLQHLVKLLFASRLSLASCCLAQSLAPIYAPWITQLSRPVSINHLAVTRRYGPALRVRGGGGGKRLRRERESKGSIFTKICSLVAAA